MARVPRKVYRGVRAAKYTRLKRIISMIYADDAREQASAADAGRQPDVFSDSTRVQSCLERLLDQCSNKLSEKR